MRPEMVRAFGRARYALGCDDHDGTVALSDVRDELAGAYEALPVGKRVSDDPDATLAERIVALDGDLVRWRLFAERLRAQLASEAQVQDRHDVLAVANGWGAHPAGQRQGGGCPGCVAVSGRARDAADGSIPAADEVPDHLTDALLDGLTVAGFGHTTLDIRPAAARAAVVAVLRAWLAGGQT